MVERIAAGSGRVLGVGLPDDQVDDFLAGRDAAVRALALASRDIVLDIFPDAVETAEGNDLGYGFDTGYKGLVFTISLTSTGVNLGVYGGASLDDPAGLLEGTGKVHRHVKILTQSDLDDELRDLLTRALDRRNFDS
jgi:Domain of unknown function (DUF5655)